MDRTLMACIESTVEIDATPEDVWRTLTDFARYPEWNPLIVAASGELDAGCKITLHVRIGPLPATIHPTVVEVVPAARLFWRGTLGPGALFEGVHGFALQPLPGGRTRLIHTETFDGILRPLLAPILKRTVSGFEAMDQALKLRVEAHQTRTRAVGSR